MGGVLEVGFRGMGEGRRADAGVVLAVGDILQD